MKYWSYAMLLGGNTEYLYQDEITFECDLGFHIPWLDQSKSSLHSTCQADGQWSHEMPSSCTSVLCPMFPEQPHTLFRVRKSGQNYRQSLIEFTDQVTFYCDEGYEIGDRQNLTATCTANGGYTVDLPSNLCQRESLPDSGKGLHIHIDHAVKYRLGHSSYYFETAACGKFLTLKMLVVKKILVKIPRFLCS